MFNTQDPHQRVKIGKQQLITEFNNLALEFGIQVNRRAIAERFDDLALFLACDCYSQAYDPQVINSTGLSTSDEIFYSWEMDTAGKPLRFVDLDESACKYLGYSRDEVLSLSPARLQEFTLPDMTREALLSITGNRRFVTEHSHLPGDGREIVRQTSSHLAVIDGKNIVCTTIRTIVNPLRTPQPDEIAEQHFRLINKQVPAVIWTTDTDLRLVSFSGYNAGQELLDRIGDIRGLTLMEYFKTDDPGFHPIEEHRKALDGCEGRYEKSSPLGHMFDCTIHPLYDDEGDIIGTIGIGIDITQRRKAEIKLQEQEARLRLISEQVPCVMWTVDKNLCYTSLSGQKISENVRKLLPEIMGKSLYWYFGTDDPEFGPIAAHRKALQGESVRCEMAEELVYEMEMNPLRDETGEIIGVTGVAMDITDRKRLEEELLRKNKELDDFAYMVSHDLKAPLTTIGWMVDLIKENPEDLEVGLGNIAQQSDYLVRQIEGLLEFSRAGKILAPFEDIDLDDLVRGVFTFCTINREPARLIIPEPLPHIQGDQIKIEQVFSNLLRNAIACRNPENEVSTIEITWNEEDGKLTFRVQDDGIGIAPEHLNRIFIPSFTTRKGKGTGFGLPISSKIIQAHNGTIWAESAGKNKGAAFCIQLPR